MPTDASTSRAGLLWAVPAAVLCGAGVATQARINGSLGAELDDGFAAALVSFASGLVILSLALLVFRPGRAGVATARAALVDRSVPWWYFLGGAAGALFVVSQGLTSIPLGIALFSVGVVSGQTTCGVLVDRAGIGTMPPRPLTVGRVLGALLALAAVALAGSSQLRLGPESWLLLLPVVAGFGIAWQQAVNGQIRQRTGSALAASFVNFLVGTVLLGIVVLARSVIVGWPERFPAEPVLYLGGVIGVVFLALGAVVVGITGVLLLALGTVGGQLLMALILDLVLPVGGHELQWTTFAGVALALCAVVLVALSGRPRRARASR